MPVKSGLIRKRKKSVSPPAPRPATKSLELEILVVRGHEDKHCVLTFPRPKKEPAPLPRMFRLDAIARSDDTESSTDRERI